MHVNIRKFNYEATCEYERFINAEELTKSNRFKYPYGKERSILSKAWTREYLSEVLDVEPLEINISRTVGGKPYLVDFPNVFFNISHSGDYFAIVVNEGRDVGIDIEKLKVLDNLDKLAEKAFGFREREILRRVSDLNQKANLFYYLWTRREAVVKCLGKKMAGYFKVDVLPSCEILHEFRTCRKPFEGVEVIDRVELHDEYAIAVARLK